MDGLLYAYSKYKNFFLKKFYCGVEFDDSNTEAWEAELEYNERSTILANTVRNEMLILINDEDYANFAFNEMTGRIQVTGALPWQRPEENKFWRDADTAQLKARLDLNYGVFSIRNHEVSFTKVADDRRFHPWEQQIQGEDLLVGYRAEKFIEFTDGVEPLTEMDTDFMLKTLDHIKVFEDGTLLVVFLNGTGILETIRFHQEDNSIWNTVEAGK